MKRGFVVAVAGAAIVVVGLSGCSKDSDTSTSATTKVNGTEVATGTGKAKVTIDGKDQAIEGGSISCVTAAGVVTIGIGSGTSAIGVTLTEGDSPKVNTVGLGNINGVTLAVGPGAGNAEATKDGKDYKITGNATGVDMANPLTPVNKPFEIAVTCP